jgi:imidazole glycerol-phosphate synthase subunit HisF
VLKTRVIPVLLWDNRGLCKPVAFKRPGRFVGSLMSAALLYEQRTCDELILLDIHATEKRRAPRFEEVKQFTAKLFCPITFGGGISSIDGIRSALCAGADKVVIRSHATPDFIREASRRFGSQCISVAIDYLGKYYVDLTIVGMARQLENDGAGEIILTDMNRDGMRCGYDLAMLESVCNAVRIPVVANGGCSCPLDMVLALRAGAHAVAASSMFLYDNITPQDCKEYLDGCGIPVRIEK